MRAVYTTNLIVLHVFTLKTSLTWPSTPSLWQDVRRPYKTQRFRHFVPFNQGPVNINFMKQKRCFFTVWPNAHFKDNPSLIQAPLPALNPFRWILKIPGFTAIKYSSMTQKTAPTFYVTSPVHPTSSQFNPLFTAQCSSGSSQVRAHSLNYFTKRGDTWRTEHADRPVLNHNSLGPRLKIMNPNGPATQHSARGSTILDQN